MPVDAAKLGASLETFVRQFEWNFTLRLCHRYGNSQFSRLPQELLDVIIAIDHRLAFETIYPDWRQASACFESQCDISDHAMELETDGYVIEGKEEDEIFDYIERSHYKKEQARLMRTCLCKRENQNSQFSFKQLNRVNESQNSAVTLSLICITDVEEALWS